MPPGFVYTSQPCGSSHGGGLAIIHRKKCEVLLASAPTFNSFESTVCQPSGPVPTITATVYRPPKANISFIHDSAALLTHLATLSPNVILLGDFNIHMDNINLPLSEWESQYAAGSQSYQDRMRSHRSKGHILDLVCCSGLIPSNCIADELPITDQLFLSFNIQLILSSTQPPYIISYRNIKNMMILIPLLSAPL